jgi:hypothetical protein
MNDRKWFHFFLGVAVGAVGMFVFLCVLAMLNFI